MAGSGAPTSGDIRSMLRLSHSLHTSSEPAARKKLLLAGMCELLGADSALDVVAHAEPARRRHTIVSLTRHGPGRLSEDQLLKKYLPRLARPHCPPPEVTQWQHLAGPARAGSRQLHHCLWCHAPLSEARVVACLLVSRSPDRRRNFTAHDRLLLHLAHVEMSWIYQTDLLLATRGAAALSPRQRQTLQFLLAGHSEKQIAEQMRLSPNTVHHHVKAIHRHFAVSSRSELLARWLN